MLMGLLYNCLALFQGHVRVTVGGQEHGCVYRLACNLSADHAWVEHPTVG